MFEPHWCAWRYLGRLKDARSRLAPLPLQIAWLRPVPSDLRSYGSEALNLSELSRFRTARSNCAHLLHSLNQHVLAMTPDFCWSSSVIRVATLFLNVGPRSLPTLLFPCETAASRATYGPFADLPERPNLSDNSFLGRFAHYHVPALPQVDTTWRPLHNLTKHLHPSYASYLQKNAREYIHRLLAFSNS